MWPVLSGWALKRFSIHAKIFEIIHSTNDEAKKFTSEQLALQFRLQETLFIAKTQTAGRGRGHHTWISPDSGTSLLATWVMPLTQTSHPILTLKLGLELYEAACEVFPEVAFSLKAPNDLFIGNQKVAGILVEAIQQGTQQILIVGLGFNLTNSPAQLDIATHLAQHTPLSEASLVRFLDSLYDRWRNLAEQSNQLLSETQREKLLLALNKWPALPAKYTQIEPNGNLLTATGVTPWHAL